MACNIRGHLLYSTLATWPGVGQPLTLLSDCRWENIWLLQCMFSSIILNREHECGPNGW